MKRAEHFYKLTSQIHDIDLKVVTAVNNFYWKTGVSSNLSKVVHSGIYLKHLGTIVISRYKLRIEISQVIFKITRLRYNTRHTEEYKQNMRAIHYRTLHLLLEKRNELAHFYYQIQIKQAKLNMR